MVSLAHLIQGDHARLSGPVNAHKDRMQDEEHCRVICCSSCQEALRCVKQMETTITHCGSTIDNYSKTWNALLQKVEIQGNNDATKTSKHVNHNCVHCMVCTEHFPKYNGEDESNYILALGCGN